MRQTHQPNNRGAT